MVGARARARASGTGVATSAIEQAIRRRVGAFPYARCNNTGRNDPVAGESPGIY